MEIAYNQPKSCDRTNMQLQFLENFPRSRQQKLIERWFSASAGLNKMDSAKAIEEKLAKAEERRLARFQKTETTDDKVMRAVCNAIDRKCDNNKKVDVKSADDYVKPMQNQPQVTGGTPK